MRHAFLVILLCCLATPAALAQDALPTKSETPADRVQLVEDDENGVLRIVIDGKEVGRFDAAGLRVEDHVEGSSRIFIEDVSGEPLPGLSEAEGATP